MERENHRVCRTRADFVLLFDRMRHRSAIQIKDPKSLCNSIEITSVKSTLGLLLGLFVSGCASYEGLLPINSQATAEVAQQEPELASTVHPKIVPARASSVARRERELAMLPKNSPEWWALHNKIEADEDLRLAKTLIICRGCDSSGSRETQAGQAQPLRPGSAAELRVP